jgi:hypothetical protein
MFAGDAGPTEYNTDDGPIRMIGPCLLTSEQYAVFSALVDESGQKLLKMHGGGGCGMSHVEMTERGWAVVCCCPSGVGASLLPNGQTFHAMFKAFVKDLNAGALIDTISERSVANGCGL